MICLAEAFARPRVMYEPAKLGFDQLYTYFAWRNTKDDLLSDARYLWHGTRNFVQLAPQIVPAHVLRIRRRSHTERDFEYYL